MLDGQYLCLREQPSLHLGDAGLLRDEAGSVGGVSREQQRAQAQSPERVRNPHRRGTKGVLGVEGGLVPAVDDHVHRRGRTEAGLLW